MPSDFSVLPIGSLSPVGPARQQPRQRAAKVAHASAAQGDTPAVATDTPHFSDPDRFIDPLSDLLAMTFRDSGTTDAARCLTQEQLDAYRRGCANRPGSAD